MVPFGCLHLHSPLRQIDGEEEGGDSGVKTSSYTFPSPVKELSSGRGLSRTLFGLLIFSSQRDRVDGDRRQWRTRVPVSFPDLEVRSRGKGGVVLRCTFVVVVCQS